MLTVLAIDKNIICELDEFESLFSNVEKRGKFKVCSWNREGKNLFQAIPALFDRHFISENELREWNIIIVSDNRNGKPGNPFGGDYINDRENLPDAQLNEIAKMLGIVPANSHVSYEIPDNKFGNLKWNVDVNRELRNEKLAEYRMTEFARPQKIFLWSVVRKNDVDIDEFSKACADAESTLHNFGIKARYPVNCRFLRFNLSSVSNTNTREDYFRLWMSLLTFVYNDPDAIFLSPDTLYNIDCDIDKRVLKNQISTIYSRVHYVKKSTTLRIEEIEKRRDQIRQKHYDVPNLNSNINVKFDVNDDGLYLNTKKFGLAKNCPCADEPEYKFQREIIESRIFSFLKAPKRALKRAVRATKENGVFVADTEEKIHLDEDQTEDLNEEIDKLEVNIFGSAAVDTSYEKRNFEARKSSDKETEKTMKKRSPVIVVVLGSLAAFLAVLAGFIPYIVNAFITKNNQTVADSFMITFVSLFIMALAGFITLLILRIPLSQNFKHFKKLIKELVRETKALAPEYTLFLSKFSSFMKMNSFNNYLRCNNNVFMLEEEIMLRKNREYSDKIEQMCRNWGSIFDFEVKYSEKKANKYFEIDEYPQKNPLYSFVIKSGEYKIMLNDAPSSLSAPYEFIKSVNITLEEDE